MKKIFLLIVSILLTTVSYCQLDSYGLIKYKEDVSHIYDENTLVPKSYVDDSTNVYASEGLYKDGDTIKLGGKISNLELQLYGSSTNGVDIDADTGHFYISSFNSQGTHGSYLGVQNDKVTISTAETDSVRFILGNNYTPNGSISMDDSAGFTFIYEDDLYLWNDNGTRIGLDDISTKQYVNSNIDSLFLKETTSRTIYVATTGSDITGDGSIGNPYASILKALKNIKNTVQNSTITISISGIGDFPITYDETNELAKKTFINSILAFTGTSYTILESGFTVSKIQNTSCSYKLNKVGLVSILDQYRDYFITNGTSYYPIAYNTADTNGFEIEFVNENFSTATSIINFGVTITNPLNLGNFFDLGFGSNINSSIIINNLNINSGTLLNIIFNNNSTAKEFNNVKIICRGMQIGSSQNDGCLPINFKQCIIRQGVATTSSLIWVYNNVTKVNFVRTLLDAPLSITQGILFPSNSSHVSFQNGVYIRGTGNAIYGLQGPCGVSVQSFLKIRDCTSFLYPGDNCKITVSNKNGGITNCFYEFSNVTNLFSIQPRKSCVVQIPFIYGNLPQTLISGTNSGYILVDDKNDIHVSIAGIYGEKEPIVVSVLEDNFYGTIDVGDDRFNESVIIEYKINRGILEEVGTIVMTKKQDTNLYDVSYFDDCGVSFTKSVNNNIIKLNWATTSTGSNAILKYTIKRIML